MMSGRYYKRRTKQYGEGQSQKSYHLYLDEELIPFVEKLANKNRFFNDAIRDFIRRRLEISEK